MTVGAFRPAVVARLAGWRVEDDREGAALKASLPYLLVEFPPPLMGMDRWSSRDFTADGAFTVTVVAASRRTAEGLHDAVEARLVDWVPVVPGWSTWPVSMATRPRLQPPYTRIPDRVLHEVVTSWTWHAEPVTRTP